MQSMPKDTPKLVAIEVKPGALPIWIETTDDHLAGQKWVRAAAGAEKDVPQSMEDSLERLRPLVETLFEKMAGAAQAPKEIELNLGLKLSGKVGLFVAESSGEASLSVKLKWVL